MKIRFLILLLIAFPLLEGQADATQNLEVSLQLPKNFASKVCPEPLWTDLEVVWQGTLDERTNKAVAWQKRKKNRESGEVHLDRPLRLIVDDSLKDLLKTCGMNLTAEGQKDDLYVSAVIEKFAIQTNSPIRGMKGVKSLIFLNVQKNDRTILKVGSGFQIEDKKKGKNNLRHVKKILTELLYDTLNQIPRHEDFRNLKKVAVESTLPPSSSSFSRSPREREQHR